VSATEHLGPQFTLYHGTQKRNLAGIQEKGLTRGMTSSRFQDAEGFGSHVLEMKVGQEHIQHQVHGNHPGKGIFVMGHVPPENIVAVHEGQQPVFDLRED